MQIVWRCSPEQESQNEEYKKLYANGYGPAPQFRVRFASLIPYLDFEEIIRQLSIIKYIYICKNFEIHCLGQIIFFKLDHFLVCSIGGFHVTS